MKVTPCLVTYKRLEPVHLAGRRFHVHADGTVETGYGHGYGEILTPEDARLVRAEASRQRRNRSARERTEVMRDLGLKKTRYGWE